MFKKSLFILVILSSLLFNIQAGFTHDVEHINHESHDSLIDCEDCVLKHHIAKSHDLSNSFDFEFSNHTDPNQNYLQNNSIAYAFVAYQSQAP